MTARSRPNAQPAPQGVPPTPIEARQLEPDMIRLQRAAAVAHHRGQTVEVARVVVSVLLAVAGVALTAMDRGSLVMGVIGFAWFVVSTVGLRPLSNNSATTAALIQEQFDTKLFYLPWRSQVAGNPVADHDVSRLERKLQRRSARDQRILDGWYDPTKGLHHPYDVLVSQEQNLAWDLRLRRRYARAIAAAAVAWTVLGLAMAFSMDAAVAPLLTFFVPSLAVYGLAFEIWAAQNEIAAERKRLGQEVADELRAAQPGAVSTIEWNRLRESSRNIQDGILRTRCNTSRVPEWFYSRFRDSDEEDFGTTAEAHRRRLS